MNSKSSLHAVPGPAGHPVIFSLNRFWLKCGFEPVAQRLDITPETVKSHTKSIFAKLAAQTRAQAVAHGEALGLIQGAST